jgi:integrase
MRYTKDAPYIYTKRSVYYFSRRVPEDLKVHYKRHRIVLSLRTKSLKAAQARTVSLIAKLDEDWLTLRWRSSSDPFSRFLVDVAMAQPTVSSAPYLSEAKELYLRIKGNGRSKTFFQSADRAVGYMIKLLGDRPIDTYTRAEVNQLRDALSERGLRKTSIRRNFSTIRAIANFSAREHDLKDIQSFSGVYLGEDETSTQTRRLPIPFEDILRVQTLCRQLDDEARWLIALISDTGMRLSEATGLLKSDVVLDAKHPHLTLKAHPWRRLKTRGSERVVPLVGMSLWAAERAVNSAQGSFMFPKYCNEKVCKANSASGALNKWLSPRVPSGCVIHSFRHSLRDRLRAVECPPDIIDRIGGWAVGGIGEGYGSGYPVSVLHKWMKQIE